uniref:Uncharacterized protein n=1 Tax=Arundo donax TaxID=35708 RepID=A0A0A9CC67_ARUDO
MDNSKVQLMQKVHGTDAVFRDLEPPLFLHPCPPAVILVCTLLTFLFDHHISFSYCL